MNSIQVNNCLITGNKFPTLNKAWEGSLYKKVGFVFLSVLTAGILPLSLIIYDISKGAKYGRNLNAFPYGVPYGVPLNKKFRLDKDLYETNVKKLKGIPYINRCHFSIPKSLSKDLRKVRDIAISAGVISITCLGLIYLVKKSTDSGVATNSLNTLRDKMQEISSTMGSSLYSLKNGFSDTAASYLNIFSDKMQEVSGMLTKFSNGLSSEQVFAAELTAGFVGGFVVLKKLIKTLKNSKKNPIEEEPCSRPIPNAPVDLSAPEPEKIYFYSTWPPKAYDPDSGQNPPSEYPGY